MTPPPLPRIGPIDIWAKNSALGLHELFNEDVYIQETPHPLNPIHLHLFPSPSQINRWTQCLPAPLILGRC
ncbi:hypothetical protein HanHA300_Chr03g0083891 [Helianthus annuus]|nr:hypothetical protein HanHA300_Chr03g0083891 [Helianthus annuus]KAJ0607325.1 hypothetical protein HanHA89_Chr03g0095401 [Helianthus annuus]KAJ0767383.1 hypothetical protein HanLR1_Chr03g0088661 [Helianthus annuus]